MKNLIKSLAIILIFFSVGILVQIGIHSSKENKSRVLEEDMIVVDVPPQLPCQTCVYIEESNKVNNQGSPILYNHLVKDGSIVNTVESISGRAYTQDLNRNVANNSSPSPSGEYVIMPETVGYHSETGGVFIPYEPLFDTERSALGFHIDPSWGLDNGENGTRGCNAVKSKEDFNTLREFIVTNSVNKLIIK